MGKVYILPVMYLQQRGDNIYLISTILTFLLIMGGVGLILKYPLLILGTIFLIIVLAFWQSWQFWVFIIGLLVIIIDGELKSKSEN